MKADVIIIGGGIAGLAAAASLQASEVDWLLLEAADECGGRIRTDSIDGALVDHGFQVLNTSYPALHRSVDLEQLRLASFQLGARIMVEGRMSAFYDPQRLPGRALTSLGSSPANLGDYTALARLSLANAGNDPVSLDSPCLEVLPQLGFSERFIHDFMAPFFRAVFLDSSLDIAWKHMREMILLFSQGLASLPAEGMQALPRQMASQLDSERIHTGMPVVELENGNIRLQDGSTAQCRLAIVATSAAAASRLLGLDSLPQMNAVRSYHYAAEEAPTRDPILYLPGKGEQGPLSSLAIPGNVHESYRFGERQQVVANTLVLDEDSAAQRSAVERQLSEWYGEQTAGWELLHVHDVQEALPVPSSMGSLPGNDELVREKRLLLCGDYPGTPSINRALASGRSAGNLAAMHLRINRLS